MVPSPTEPKEMHETDSPGSEAGHVLPNVASGEGMSEWVTEMATANKPDQ